MWKKAALCLLKQQAKQGLVCGFKKLHDKGHFYEAHNLYFCSTNLKKL